MRIAAAATTLESGPTFRSLSEILAEMPALDAKDVVDGVIPDPAPEGLMRALRAVAHETERIRDHVAGAELAEIIVGRVKEIHESYVLLVLMSGPETLIPRWMARAAGRATVGALLALVTDKLDGASAVVEALPAIDVNDDTQIGAFTPFGRSDKRALSITAADERLLAGEPEPLHVLIPVAVQR
ncbi:hypothetical protein [Dactylosporangium sp. CA-092794]|uniref:hypothetical protein n=1 Tax=Dactylosporangium sp. CA-092794 TaxID=3239929 RepID=UPI003D8B9574